MWNPIFSCVPIWRIENFIASRSFHRMRLARGRRTRAYDILTPLFAICHTTNSRAALRGGSFVVQNCNGPAHFEQSPNPGMLVVWLPNTFIFH